MTEALFDIGLMDPRSGAMVAASFPSPVASPALMPNPVNLVRSSRIPTDDTQGRWVNGFAYTPEGIGVSGVFDACSGNFQEMNHVDPFKSDWQPYVLSAQYTCSTFGFDENDYEGRAKRLLEAATPTLLEWEFWGGPLSVAAGLVNTHLSGYAPAAIPATTIQKAIGIIENALGDCSYGGRGMIHMPPFLTSYLGAMARREGNLLLTARDTIIVPGAGYARYAGGRNPNAAVDLYGTGITDVRLGDIIVEEPMVIDRAVNTIVVKAQRYACVSWDELCEVRVTLTY